MANIVTPKIVGATVSSANFPLVNFISLPILSSGELPSPHICFALPLLSSVNVQLADHSQCSAEWIRKRSRLKRLSFRRGTRAFLTVSSKPKYWGRYAQPGFHDAIYRSRPP